MSTEPEEEKMVAPEREARYLWNVDNCEVEKGDGPVLINLDDYFAGRSKAEETKGDENA